jgi:uncharacterized membrane protein
MNSIGISFGQLARILVALLFASVVGAFMLVLRWWIAGEFRHLYLVWNLFLAWVPLGFAVATCLIREMRLPWRWPLGWGALAWLVFFPNAPYIITDLVHLRSLPPVPLWFDLLLLALFALTGLMLGFVSLHLMQRLVMTHHGWLSGWGFACGAIALGSFGIYLGRFQRWNSWHAVSQPFSLGTDILDRLFNPFEHPRTWGFSLLCFAFLFCGYAMFHATAGLTQASQPRTQQL